MEALLARGETKITVLDLAPSPLFEKEIAEGSVKVKVGSITDLATVEAAIVGVDVVIHSAAIVNYW